MIRILLVDDQKTIQEALKIMLKSAIDFQIVGTANDGYAAIEQAKTLQPDVILIDMEMPKLDGVSATRILSQEWPHIKVLVLSMHNNDEYVAQALQAGAIGYLLKDTPSDDLIAAIRFVYKGYAQIGPGLFGKVIPHTQPTKPVAAAESLLQSTPTVASDPNLLDRPRPNPDSSVLSAQFLPPTLDRPNPWLKYLGWWVLGNALVWGLALGYLKMAKPSYTSTWAVTLPEANSSTNLNLPGIGEAYSRTESPFNSHSSDPRENYKFLAETNEVLEAASQEARISLEEFGEPTIEIVDNATLMEFRVKGDTPEQAYQKAIALQNALQNRIADLRTEKIAEQDQNLQQILGTAKQNLQQAQQRLSQYKSRSPLSSPDQIRDLSANIETLRRQRSETLAQLQLASASFQQLSGSLDVSSQQANDAFILQSDPLFQQYLADYSRTSAELVNLEAKFTPANPEVIDKKEEKESARNALVRRGQSLLGRSASQETLEQLALNGRGESGAQRASLFQEVISLQARQQGLDAQARELTRQISQLESRLSNLSQQESSLASLQRDIQIAEAVFSSTVTRLDLSKSDIFASYPQIQTIAKPNLPKEASSPKTKLLLLGAAMGSLFLTTGLLSLWWRDRKRYPRPALSLIPSFNHHNALPESESVLPQLNPATAKSGG